MIIVQGTFQIAADDRAQFVAETLETQRISRSEPGCIEYVFAIDPVEPSRVVLSERWESRADLDAHIAALTSRRKAEAADGVKPMAPVSREVRFFEASEFDLH